MIRSPMRDSKKRNCHHRGSISFAKGFSFLLYHIGVDDLAENCVVLITIGTYSHAINILRIEILGYICRIEGILADF